MDKLSSLKLLRLDLESRKDIPLIKSPNDVVFGDGNPNSQIMFIGEAAGYHESIEHKPFVGQAGKLLMKTLKDTLNLERKDVYISNMVKARPPQNRDPFPNELEAFSQYLDKEIEIIQPKYIVTLGRFSMGKFMPGVTISRVHGVPRKIGNYIIFPMYHPAAALRAGEMMKAFLEDFNKLKLLMLNSKPETEKLQPSLF